MDQAADRPLLSLAMIVRNEAAQLERCLASVAGVCDELVVVDTGSTDHSVKIALSYNAKVVPFAWSDDFSAARNESLNACKGKWCIYLDADEWLLEPDRNRLLKLKTGLPNQRCGYLLRQLSGTTSGGQLAIDQVRLFPLEPSLRWEGLVHEQIGPALLRAGLSMQRTTITFQHSGYQDASILAAKSARNLELLRRQVELTPNDPVAQFHWGQAVLQAGEVEQGLRGIEFAYQHLDKGLLFFRHVACTLLQLCIRLDDTLRAWQVIQEWPSDRQIPHAMLIAAADLHWQVGRTEEALQCLQHAADIPLPNTATYDNPLLPAQARFKLGWFYFERQQHQAATQQFLRLLEHPLTSVLGHKGLGSTAMLRQEFSQALKHAKALLETEHGKLDGYLLQAQVWMRSGNLSLARELMESLATQHPDDVTVQNFLAQAYLRDRSTWAQARTALNQVLTLAPHHSEALQNLSVVERALGGSE